MEKNNTTVIALLTLLLGLGLGYGLASNKTISPSFSSRDTNGTHMMSNGQMMGNGGSMNMEDMMTSMNAGLRGKTGDEFDQAFLSEMIIHHTGAVEMAQLALTNAKHQEIKDLAQAIISAQNKEIGDMSSWQKSWFNK